MISSKLARQCVFCGSPSVIFNTLCTGLKPEMSSRHLETGDPLPPYTPGTYRLFNMKYCPYAERARYVLHAKGIKYEEVNCNLKKKPEFLIERNPAGLVPVLEKDGIVVRESIIICDLLEDLFPNPPLYPADAYERAKSKLLIRDFDQKFARTFIKLVKKSQDGETLTSLVGSLQEYDDLLKGQGTLFFGGSNPNMVDYIVWPWFQRIAAQKDGGAMLCNAFPALRSYIEAMNDHPVVKAVKNTPEELQMFHDFLVSGSPQYDFTVPTASL